MQAQNRLLPEWFNRVRTGQIRLPRFQRFEAWGSNEVSGLIEAVLRGLPAGAALVLEVGDQEKFISRVMSGAPAPTERVTEHLLDGQQRLTALWKSLNDHYEDRTYFVYFETDIETEREEPEVFGQARWLKNGRRFPVWADIPADVYSRGYIPLKLLRPGDLSDEIGRWCDSATGNDPTASRDLERKITKLRERVTTYNIPFLALPVTTPKDIALDVFIKLNTSSVKLTPFDIVVAEIEDRTGQSLHDLVNKLREEVPQVVEYIAPEDLILSVAAMREDKAPTQASYQKLDLDRLVADWANLVAGIKWAVETLEEEHVFDSVRLPTVAVLYSLSALHDYIPSALDARGNAKILIRKYLWRAFLTRRYENAAATMALQDLRGLRSALRDGAPHGDVPIFDDERFPLPTVGELCRAGWPKAKDILARGILAASLKAGALDLADGERATRNHLGKREYHHLFPDHLLTEDGQLPEGMSYLALNCALVTWNTNRNISAKEPLAYLTERTARGVLGEEALRGRLKSHIIPYEALNAGGYAAITNTDQRAAKIKEDYDRFLIARAESILQAAAALCRGID